MTHHMPNLRSRMATLSIAAALIGCFQLCGWWSHPTALATPIQNVATTTTYLPLVLNLPVSCNDSEDNDIPAQAKQLITVGRECIGSLEDDPVGEDDYYSVTLNPGQSITIDLAGMLDGADYDLLLYRETVLVASSNEQGSASEHLSYTNTSGVTTTYLIRINIFAKSTAGINTYILKTSSP